MTALAISLAGEYLYFGALQLLGEPTTSTITGSFFVLLCALYLASVFRNASRTRYRRGLGVFAAFVACILINWLLLVSFHADATEKIRFMPVFMIAPFIAGYYVDTRRDIKGLLSAIWWLAIGLALLTLIVWVRRGFETSGEYGSRLTPIDTWNPISQAVVLSVGILISFARLPHCSGSARVGHVTFIVIALVFIVLSGSRGPLISLMICGGLFLALRRGRGGKWALAGAVLVAVAAYGSQSLLPQTVRSRYDLEAITTEGNVEVNSYLQRADAYQTAIEQFVANPVIGIGFGNFQYHSELGLQYAHNMLLEVLSELGIIGLLFIVPVWWRSLRTSTQLLRSIATESSTSLIALLFVFYFCEAMMSGSVGSDDGYWFWTGVMLNIGSSGEPRTEGDG